MTQYKSDFPFPVAFPPQTMDNVLAEWLAKNDIPQAHVAETEKYAHVTFFFNGGTEAQFPLEERRMIASPKVATYDLQPTMSAQEVADKVAEEIASENYPFVMCNFAPPDMVSCALVLLAFVKSGKFCMRGHRQISGMAKGILEILGFNSIDLFTTPHSSGRSHWCLRGCHQRC